MPEKNKPNILSTPQGAVVTLADGQEYQLSPMNLNVLANLEDAFDCNLDELQSIFETRTTTNFRKFLKVMLQENYPDLSLEDVGRLVVIDQVKPLLEQLTSAISVEV